MDEGDPIRPSAVRVYQVAWAVYLVMASGGAVWMGLSRGGLTVAQFVDPATWWLDLLWGVAAGVALLALWLLGRTLLPAARDLERLIADVLGGLSAGDALALALISGFAEELFFRGAVQGSWGVVPATVLFALLHAGPGRPFLIWALFALVAGAVFAGLAVSRGNLLAPMAAHVLVNSVNLRRLAAHGAAPTADSE